MTDGQKRKNKRNMDYKKTFDNLVMIKLDPENTSIKLTNGFELYVDNTFDPEKHAVVTGEVYGLPSKLSYTKEGGKGMPWLTDIELRYGDKVIVYYLSIVKAFAPETRRYVLENGDRYVFVPYSSIYAKYGNGFVQPINGYVLIEPCEDPFVADKKKRLNALGLELVSFNTKSNTHCTFGVVRYVSTPNREYVDEGTSDDGVDVAVGDTVVLRRTNDIPLQYELHARIDGGKKYLRVQRRNILAKI
jgi:hypothetical protein